MGQTWKGLVSWLYASASTRVFFTLCLKLKKKKKVWQRIFHEHHIWEFQQKHIQCNIYFLPFFSVLHLKLLLKAQFFTYLEPDLSPKEKCVSDGEHVWCFLDKPSFSEHWIKAETRRETEMYNSPPGLGMMGVPGGPPPPGGPWGVRASEGEKWVPSASRWQRAC